MDGNGSESAAGLIRTKTAAIDLNRGGGNAELHVGSFTERTPLHGPWVARPYRLNVSICRLDVVETIVEEELGAA